MGSVLLVGEYDYAMPEKSTLLVEKLIKSPPVCTPEQPLWLSFQEKCPVSTQYLFTQEETVDCFHDAKAFSVPAGSPAPVLARDPTIALVSKLKC